MSKKILYILLLVALSFVSGLSGGYFAVKYDLADQQTSNPNTSINGVKESTVVDLSEKAKSQKVSEQAYQPIFAEYDNFLFGIAKKKDLKKSDQPFYTEKDILMTAIAITDDGWIVTFGDINKDFVALKKNNSYFNIETVIKDSVTQLSFIKIQGLTEKSVDFSNETNIAFGLDSYVLKYGVQNNSVEGVSIKSKQSVLNGLEKKSDQIDKYYLLDKKFDQTYTGSAVINASGLLLGLYVDEERVIPVDYVRNALLHFLKKKTFEERASLGLTYIDISSVAGDYQSLFSGESKGAYVFSTLGLAVKKEGLAAKYKINSGTLIISLDNVLVDGTKDIAELLMQYRKGDEIKLKIKQGNIFKDLTIVL